MFTALLIDEMLWPPPPDQYPIVLRRPKAKDAASVAAMVAKCPPLERNTGYAYVLMCTHFAETSVIAENENQIAGFVFGYRIPGREDTVFVWQIGVDPKIRGKGLGKLMLRILAQRNGPTGVQFIEATVGKSNEPSMKLFRGYAQKWNYALQISNGYEGHLFDTPDHETEDLVRIGPLH